MCCYIIYVTFGIFYQQLSHCTLVVYIYPTRQSCRKGYILFIVLLMLYVCA